MVTTNVLEEFKERMKLSDAEDDNLRTLLSFSISSIKSSCGDFNIEENKDAKELVFERTRYLYNDAVEYFEDNFISQITRLGLSLAGDDNEEV